MIIFIFRSSFQQQITDVFSTNCSVFVLWNANIKQKIVKVSQKFWQWFSILCYSNALLDYLFLFRKRFYNLQLTFLISNRFMINIIKVFLFLFFSFGKHINFFQHFNRSSFFTFVSVLVYNILPKLLRPMWCHTLPNSTTTVGP